MQTIETSVRVGADRKLLMQLPEAVPAGEYEVVLVLNQRTIGEDRPKQTTALDKARGNT